MSNLDLGQDTQSWSEKLQYFIAEHKMAISLAWTRLYRQRFQTLAAVSLIAFSMSLSLLFAFFLKSSYEISQQLTQSSTMTIYLQDHVSQTQFEQLTQFLDSFETLGHAQLIEPDQIAREVFQDDLPATMRQSLPTLLSVSLSEIPEEYQTEKYLMSLKEQLSDHPLIYQVDLDLQWHGQLQALLHLGQYLGWGVGLVLISTVIIMTNYTIRMTLEKFRDEIAIYHDLGAAGSFIQRPYVYQGLFMAGTGAFLTLVFILCGYFTLAKDLKLIEQLLRVSLEFSMSDLFFILKFLVSMIVFAWVCAMTSIRNWLNVFDQRHRSSSDETLAQ